jgi:glucosamine kinase
MGRVSNLNPRENTMQPPLFLGIDGGGTRCRARLCESRGAVLGEGTAGSANTRLGLDQVFNEIRSACDQALTAAGLDHTMMHQLHAGLGLAGLALTSEHEKLRRYPHPFASIIAENDAYIACLGAHQGQDGAILILGTGSCGCGIVGDRTVTVGGWGFQLSDQGSGATLGHQAVRYSLWAHENIIPATPLSRTIMAMFSDSPEQAVLWSDRAVPRDYAALAPLVFEHLQRQDPLAQTLISETADAAAKLIAALLARGAPRVALLGGLAEQLTPYLPASSKSSLVMPAGDALDGAVLMARRQHQSSV